MTNLVNASKYKSFMKIELVLLHKRMNSNLFSVLL